MIYPRFTSLTSLPGTKMFLFKTFFWFWCFKSFLYAILHYSSVHHYGLIWQNKIKISYQHVISICLKSTLPLYWFPISAIKPHISCHVAAARCRRGGWTPLPPPPSSSTNHRTSKFYSLFLQNSPPIIIYRWLDFHYSLSLGWLCALVPELISCYLFLQFLLLWFNFFST